MTRAIRWSLAASNTALAAASLLAVAAWVFSRIVTDHWQWSQYVWWIPTLAWAAGSIALLASWWVVDRLRSSATKTQGPQTIKKLARWTRRTLLALVGVMVLLAAIVEWRVYRFVSPPALPPDRAIRIANWNPAIPVESLNGPIARLDADIIAIVNQPGGKDVDDLAITLGESWSAVRSDRLSLLSRLPIRRWGITYLEIEGRVMRSYQFQKLDVRMADQYDNGRALFAEIDTQDGPLVIWVIDIPSDVSLARDDVMAKAASVIRGYKGRVFRFDDNGDRWVERIEDGFPEADVIVGDFNTIRGSQSLRTVVGDRANAFDAAGRGYGATFPRRLPAAQIDHMFVGEPWRTVTYRIFDPESGQHLAQVGDIVRDVARRESDGLVEAGDQGQK